MIPSVSLSHLERSHINSGINLTERTIFFNGRKGKWSAPKQITSCCIKKEKNRFLEREMEGLTNDSRLNKLKEDD